MDDDNRGTFLKTVPTIHHIYRGTQTDRRRCADTKRTVTIVPWPCAAWYMTSTVTTRYRTEKQCGLHTSPAFLLLSPWLSPSIIHGGGFCMSLWITFDMTVSVLDLFDDEKTKTSLDSLNGSTS